MASRLHSLYSTLREHPKKTIAGLGLGAWLINFVKTREERRQLMRRYCEVASEFGRVEVGPDWRPRRITVLVNGWAGGGGCLAQWEKWGAPLLHLAGLAVTQIKASTAEELGEIARVLSSEETDGIFVVGGDGSLSRVLTGVMQGGVERERLPVGAFPGGRRSWGLRMLWEAAIPDGVPFATEFRDFLRHSRLDDMRWAAEAAMAVVRDERRRVGLVEVELGGTAERRFGLGTLQAGAYREVDERRFGYWLLGPLRHYFALLWLSLTRPPRSFGLDGVWEEPCQGCSACLSSPAKTESRSWWSSLLPRLRSAPKPDPRLKRNNPQCGVKHELSGQTMDLSITADLIQGSLHLWQGPERLNRLRFVWEGFGRHFASAASAPFLSADGAYYKRDLEAGSVSLSLSQPVSESSQPPSEEEEEDNKIHHYSFDLRSQHYPLDPYTHRPIPIAVDGEMISAAQPLRLSLRPSALSFYLPRTFSLPPLPS